MPNQILPSVIARPSTGNISVGASPIPSSPLLGNIAKGIQSVTSGAMSAAEEYNRLFIQEQQVLVTQSHNRISSELSDFTNEYMQNAKPGDFLKFEEAFNKKSEEVFAKHSVDLSEFAQKKLRDSMSINNQMFINKAKDYGERKMTEQMLAASKSALDQSLSLAIEYNPAAGKEDLSMMQVKDAAYIRSKFNGGGDTVKTIKVYAKNSDQELPENLDNQPLVKTRAEVNSELEELRKTEPIGSEEVIKKRHLLAAIDSAIISEKAIQDTVDQVQAGRFDRFIANGDIDSARNLIENIDPGNADNKDTVSSKVFTKMKKTFKKYDDIATVQKMTNLAINNTQKEFNFRTDSISQYDIQAAEMKNWLSRNIKDPVLKDKALRLYNSHVLEQKRIYSSELLREQSSVIEAWQKNNVSQIERERQIENISPKYSSEFIDKLKKASNSIAQTFATSSTGRVVQNTVEFETMQAVKNGYGVIDVNGVKTNYPVDTAEKMKTFFLLKGGSLTTSVANNLDEMYRKKDEIVNVNTLKDVLQKYDKTVEEFVNAGGAGALPRLLTPGKVATYAELDKAVSTWMNETITTPSWFGFSSSTTKRKDDFNDSASQFVTYANMKTEYVKKFEEFAQKGTLPPWMMPDASVTSVSRFAKEFYGMELNVDDKVYILKKADPYRYIINYRKEVK